MKSKTACEVQPHEIKGPSPAWVNTKKNRKKTCDASIVWLKYNLTSLSKAGPNGKLSRRDLKCQPASMCWLIYFNQHYQAGNKWLAKWGARTVRSDLSLALFCCSFMSKLFSNGHNQQSPYIKILISLNKKFITSYHYELYKMTTWQTEQNFSFFF